MNGLSQRAPALHGLLFVALFALAALQVAQFPTVSHLGLSPLIVGILLGMVYANTLRLHLPESWVPGVLFSSKHLLRAAIILYGFRVTFQQIAAVGWVGLGVSVTMVVSTLALGVWMGTRFFKLDRDTAILTAAGSAICGAAAVVATESVLESNPAKSAVAVGTVVLFGTLSMFLYPAVYATGLLHLAPPIFGLYSGGTIHEVAQVVAATGGIAGAGEVAVIVKMVRVMLIAPVLLALGWLTLRHKTKTERAAGVRLVIPWFAVWFVVASAINSLGVLPDGLVQDLITFDNFLLTMAMTAIGMETNVRKFRQVGLGPLYLAAALFLWLVFGGYGVTRAFATMLG